MLLAVGGATAAQAEATPGNAFVDGADEAHLVNRELFSSISRAEAQASALGFPMAFQIPEFR